MQRFLSERVSTTPSTPPTPAVFIQCRLLSNGKRLQHTLRTPTHVIHLQLRFLFIREASTPPCSTPPHYFIVYHSSCAFAHRRSLWTPNRCDRCICQWCFFSDWGFRSPSLLPLHWCVLVQPRVPFPMVFLFSTGRWLQLNFGPRNNLGAPGKPGPGHCGLYHLYWTMTMPAGLFL